MRLIRSGLAVGLVALVVGAGCAPSRPADDNRSVDINAAADEARSDIANYAAGTAAASAVRARGAAAKPQSPPAPGTPGGLPDDRTPIAEGPFAADGAQAAANVVQTYYALLEARRYREAWTSWDDGGKASGLSVDAFAASFAKYAEYHANVGAPSAIDAGAGQRHVSVPVVVFGRLKSGEPVNLKGAMTLHRTADIDGATAADKAWHISSADLKPSAGGGDNAGKE